jgi:hypothetical protein
MQGEPSSSGSASDRVARFDEAAQHLLGTDRYPVLIARRRAGLTTTSNTLAYPGFFVPSALPAIGVAARNDVRPDAQSRAVSDAD